MPIYEYHCEKCGNDFEKMQSINAEEHSLPCPTCGTDANRVISHSAFHLKGAGWYTSDYKNKSACATPSSSPACESCAHAATNK